MYMNRFSIRVNLNGKVGSRFHFAIAHLAIQLFDHNPLYVTGLLVLVLGLVPALSCRFFRFVPHITSYCFFMHTLQV